MKSVAKLSLLLALVIAGRYLRPTAFADSPTSAQAALPFPTTLNYTAFTPGSALPVAPVNQRSLPAPRYVEPDTLTWF